MAVALMTFGSGVRLVAAESLPFLWSAGFESGTQSEFNLGEYATNGAVLATSNSVAYQGAYSGYYYYQGSPGGQDSRRAYPTEVLSRRPSKFLVEVWIHVPSSVDGQPVSLTDWVSFVSIWLNDRGWEAGINPITIDSTTAGELTLWLGMLPSNRNVYQAKPVKWAFDRWFKIGIQGDLKPGTADSRVTVFQDGVAIINYVGNLGDQATGLGYMHYGLYMGPNQGAYAVHNDAISVTETATVTPSTSTIQVSVQLASLKRADVLLVLSSGSTVIATNTLTVTKSNPIRTVTFQVDAGTYTLTMTGKGLKTQATTITVPPDAQLTLTTMPK